MKLVTLEESKAKPCERWDFGSCPDMMRPSPESLAEMEAILRDTKLPGDITGVALAAPQVGIFKRFFLIASPSRKQWVFNPEMRVLTQKREKVIERCLTCPGEKFETIRFASVSLTFQNELGEVIHWGACKGLLGRIVQHEMGHLDGTCIKDFGRRIP